MVVAQSLECPAPLPSLLQATITADSLRELLLEAQRECLHARRRPDIGTMPDCASALERAAKTLRNEIVKKCLESGIREDDWELDLHESASFGVLDRSESLGHSPDTTASCSSSFAGPVLATMSFQDPADDALPTRSCEVQVRSDCWESVPLGCPHCRRPLDLATRLGAPAQRNSKHEELDGSSAPRHAYCTVLTNGGQDAFVQALSLGRSLAAHSEKDRVLLHGPDVPEPYLKVLACCWTLRPISSWPVLLGKTRLPSAVDLLVLGLVEYSKVLFLSLGFVVQSCLDSVFRLLTPAALARRRDGHLDLSALLLEPSVAALHRLSSEIGVESSAAWPPRAPADGGNRGFSASDGSGSLNDYLYRFFTTFFRGRWSELPREMVPLDVRPGEVISSSSWVLNGRHCWEGITKVLLDARSSEAWRTEVTGIVPLIVDTISPKEIDEKLLYEALKRVPRKRCRQCNAYDGEGQSDPVDQKWLCRFCWEATLLDGVLQDRRVRCPILVSDLHKMKGELGPISLDSGRQRWAWTTAGSRAGWIEFRPRGVLWAKEGGVGYWERGSVKSDDSTKAPRINLHFTIESRGSERLEVRHVMQLKRAMDGSMQLEEMWRENSRPLGFGRVSHVEDRIRCWPEQKRQQRPPGYEKPVSQPPSAPAPQRPPPPCRAIPPVASDRSGEEVGVQPSSTTDSSSSCAVTSAVTDPPISMCALDAIESPIVDDPPKALDESDGRCKLSYLFSSGGVSSSSTTAPQEVSSSTAHSPARSTPGTGRADPWADGSDPWSTSLPSKSPVSDS